MIENQNTGRAINPKNVRRQWVSPRVSRMKATDAEGGANPINPEGLGFGS